MATQTLAVKGMHCASCGMLIDETLEELPGVTRSTTKVRKGRTTVEYDPAKVRVDDLVRAVVTAGYQAEPT